MNNAPLSVNHLTDGNILSIAYPPDAFILNIVNTLTYVQLKESVMRSVSSDNGVRRDRVAKTIVMVVGVVAIVAFFSAFYCWGFGMSWVP